MTPAFEPRHIRDLFGTVEEAIPSGCCLTRPTRRLRHPCLFVQKLNRWSVHTDELDLGASVAEGVFLGVMDREG
jgi:hypothetical protein